MRARSRIAIVLGGTVAALFGSAWMATGAQAVTRARHRDGPCRVLVAWTAEPAKEKCAAPPGVSTEEAQNLREEEDGAAKEGVISTNFPTNGLLSNTKSKIAFTAKIAGTTLTNESPAGYTYFGVNLMSNPTNSTTVCKAATGTVPFADIQDGSKSAVFDVGTAWSFTEQSNSTACGSFAGRIIIREITLLFETLGAGKTAVIASGTLIGKASPPNAEKCPAGGIELNVEQPGFTTEPAAEKLEITNGEAGKAALICFVSANNYLFPKEAPKWEKFTNSTGKEGIGIWNTKEP